MDCFLLDKKPCKDYIELLTMSRLVDFIMNIFANLLLLWGVVWSLYLVFTFKFEAAHVIILIFLGLIPTSLAFLIFRYNFKRSNNLNNLSDRQPKLSVSEKLHIIFYQILELKNGYIDEIDFAMRAKISSKKAHLFLQEKAREFNAKFVVTEDGDTAYKFQYITEDEINKIKNRDSLNIEIGYGKTHVNRPNKTNSETKLSS
jgi:hypothetical protein